MSWTEFLVWNKKNTQEEEFSASQQFEVVHTFEEIVNYLVSEECLILILFDISGTFHSKSSSFVTVSCYVLLQIVLIC